MSLFLSLFLGSGDAIAITPTSSLGFSSPLAGLRANRGEPSSSSPHIRCGKSPAMGGKIKLGGSLRAGSIISQGMLLTMILGAGWLPLNLRNLHPHHPSQVKVLDMHRCHGTMIVPLVLAADWGTVQYRIPHAMPCVQQSSLIRSWQKNKTIYDISQTQHPHIRAHISTNSWRT